jgi:hypothetical protein
MILIIPPNFCHTLIRNTVNHDIYNHLFDEVLEIPRCLSNALVACDDFLFKVLDVSEVYSSTTLANLVTHKSGVALH